MNIIIAGDFCPHARFLDGNADLKKSVSNGIEVLLKEADYSIVNFECPIMPENGKAVKIQKQGPNLAFDGMALDYVKSIGFDAITLANNHINDFGSEGIYSTISKAESVGLDFVGVGRNSVEANAILYRKIGNQTLAIINCCENEFSIATGTTAGANPIDPIKLYYAIRKAKNNSDYIIVIVHGGIEHFYLPTMRMKQTYRFFVDAGADAVINHHQHCYSGYEVYQGKPIFYGLGNFMFDWYGQRNSIWNEGYMVRLNVVDKNVAFELIPYNQCNESPKVDLMDENQILTFKAKIGKINQIIAVDKILQEMLDKYMDKENKDYLLALTPYSSRYLVAFFRRGWLPSFLSKKRILRLYDYLKCESHRERFIYFIESKYKII